MNEIDPAIESPVDTHDVNCEWGSDAVVEALRALRYPYIAFNPGSSFRGLHDSLVNYLGNEMPKMLLCLHEEHAVALAHGWAKVTGEPMAVAVHSNVGLMHASMAIYNAWCDRAPMLILGGTGPIDAARRRPWIDWIHTVADPAALIRDYVKWNDQPVSAKAAVESILRAHKITCTAPLAPVYLALDAHMQETKAAFPAIVPDRYRAASAAHPAPADVCKLTELLRESIRPVFLMGRSARHASAWKHRIELAELLGAAVLTDLKLPAVFPTTHPLHAAPAGIFPTASALALLREADLVVSFDWVDLGGTLGAAWQGLDIAPTVVHASLDQHLHGGWSRDYGSLAPVDVSLMCDADVLVDALQMELKIATPRRKPWFTKRVSAIPVTPGSQRGLDVPLLAATLRFGLAEAPACLIRAPLSWTGDLWRIEHPLDYLHYDGGGGIGSGPGMSAGAALALRGSGRLPLAVLGDGDFVMGCSALWTAVHYEIPLLVVVANNSSFFNDEMHQERIARSRRRSIENRWIGQRIADPSIDIAGLARARRTWFRPGLRRRGTSARTGRSHSVGERGMGVRRRCSSSYGIR